MVCFFPSFLLPSADTLRTRRGRKKTHFRGIEKYCKKNRPSVFAPKQPAKCIFNCTLSCICLLLFSLGIHQRITDLNFDNVFLLRKLLLNFFIFSSVFSVWRSFTSKTSKTQNANYEKYIAIHCHKTPLLFFIQFCIVGRFL